MHSNKFNKAILPFFKATALSLIFCLMATGAMAQSIIAMVKLKGQKEQQAEITYIAPKRGAQTRLVRLGEVFPTGTIFIIPALTEVTLKSEGRENYQVLPPGSRHQAHVGPKSESHKTFWGLVTHYIKNKLDFYKASGPQKSVNASSRSTVFTVEAVGKGVKFKTIKGQITILQKVPVKIREESKNRDKPRNREVTATKSSRLSEGMGTKAYYEDQQEEVYYDTYDDALKAVENEIRRSDQSGADPELLADAYTMLGELYLDDAQPQQAVQPLKMALDLYEQIDPDDPYIADIYLLLAEALIDSGNQDDGLFYVKLAIDLIKETLEYDVVDFKFAYAEKDYHLALSIGDDIVDDYDNLGWAFELIGDEALADRYYQMAEQLEKNLE